MGVQLIEVAARHNKHEDTANIRKVSNGYKMSTMAKTTLGINPTGSVCLAIGKDSNTDKLVIKCVSDTAEYNAKMNTQRIITSTGMVKYLEKIGNQFEISTDKNEDGYNFMNVVTVNELPTTKELATTDLHVVDDEQTTPKEPTRSFSSSTDEDLDSSFGTSNRD